MNMGSLSYTVGMGILASELYSYLCPCIMYSDIRYGVSYPVYLNIPKTKLIFVVCGHVPAAIRVAYSQKGM